MQFGALADWFVALFTGATFFLVWRQTRPPEPVIEPERQGIINDSLQFTVTVRNGGQRQSISVEEIATEPAANIAALNASLPIRVEPGEFVRVAYSVEAGLALERVVVTIRSNNRAKRYRAKL